MCWQNTLSSYEQNSVAVTFATQLEELERRSPDISNLLKVLSFFDPEGMPIKMIIEGADELQRKSASDLRSSDITTQALESQQPLLRKFVAGLVRHRRSTSLADPAPEDMNNVPNIESKVDSLITLIQSPVKLHEAIQTLQHLSLVGYESTLDSSILRIHDLIQITIQECAVRNQQHDWFRVAVALACGAFQHIDDPASHTCWPQCEAFSPHIQSLTKWDDERNIGNSDLHEANVGIARYFTARARYGEAEKLFERVLAGRAKLLGPRHLDTLRTEKGLAIVYRLQGRYAEAEVLYGRVLTGRTKLLGVNHPDTLLTAHDLASVYVRQGRYKEAEMLYKRVMIDREKLLGPEHPHTLWTVNNLAVVYTSQSRFGEAETLYKRVLKDREKVLGPEHPSTLRTIDNLADVYASLGQYSDAEVLYKRALAGNEKVLGPDHPDTLHTVTGLANNYSSQGWYGEAEVLYRRAMVGQDKLLGSKHPDTMLVVRNLVKFLDKQGRHEEATELQHHFPLSCESQ